MLRVHDAIPLAGAVDRDGEQARRLMRRVETLRVGFSKRSEERVWSS